MEFCTFVYVFITQCMNYFSQIYKYVHDVIKIAKERDEFLNRAHAISFQPITSFDLFFLVKSFQRNRFLCVSVEAVLLPAWGPRTVRHRPVALLLEAVGTSLSAQSRGLRTIDSTSRIISL